MITDDSFIDFKCPHCGGIATFPRDSAGAAQECPNCSECLIVPDDGSESGRPLPIPITTARLVLRRLTPNDWRDLLECVSDEEIFRYVDNRPLNEEEVLRWLDVDSHVRLTTPGVSFHLGIELQNGAKLVGYLSLRFLDPLRLQATLNIFVNRNHQQKGYGAEAMAGTLDFCFRDIRLHRVAASCDSRNLPACRLFQKAGFRREGEFVKDRLVDGEWATTLWHAMLADDYRSNDKTAEGGSTQTG